MGQVDRRDVGRRAATGALTLLTEPGKLNAAVGYFLIAFCVAALVLATVAFPGQPMFGTLLVLSSTRAIFSAVYELGGGKGWNQVGGRAVLSIGRRGSSREAIEGDLQTQLAGIADEAGVRKHL